MDLQKLNKSQLSRVVGRSEKVIDDWITNGVPFEKVGGRYQFDFHKVWTWRDDYIRGLGSGTKSSKKEKEALGLARDKAGLRESEERAEKLAMENAQRRKELASVEEMTEAWEGFILNCRAKLLSLSPKLAPILADENRPAVVQSEIDAAIYEALNELAGGSNAGADSASESTQ